MIKYLKRLIKKTPVLSTLCLKMLYYIKSKQFPQTQKYWEDRYQKGGNSGAGSYNRLAEFKAEVINNFVEEKNIRTVIDFGCGDGNNLALMKFPKYTGLDISNTAVKICVEKFKHDGNKSFYLYDPATLIEKGNLFKAELSLSFDVIYHILENDLYEKYMSQLFKASEKYVVIYSKFAGNKFAYHEISRDFLKWVGENQPSFKLINTIENKYKFDPGNRDNTSEASFYFFEKA